MIGLTTVRRWLRRLYDIFDGLHKLMDAFSALFPGLTPEWVPIVLDVTKALLWLALKIAESETLVTIIAGFVLIVELGQEPSMPEMNVDEPLGVHSVPL